MIKFCKRPFMLCVAPALALGAALSIAGGAAVPFAGGLFGTDAARGNLLRIGPATGLSTAIGPFGFNSPSLAYDSGTGIMYAAQGGALHLYTRSSR
jgi:hypothetical protein